MSPMPTIPGYATDLACLSQFVEKVAHGMPHELRKIQRDPPSWLNYHFRKKMGYHPSTDERYLTRPVS